MMSIRLVFIVTCSVSSVLYASNAHYHDSLASSVVSADSTVSQGHNRFPFALMQKDQDSNAVAPCDYDLFGEPLALDVKILQNNDGSWHFPNKNGALQFDPLVIGQAIQHNNAGRSCMTPLAQAAADDITGRVRTRKISKDKDMQQLLCNAVNPSVVQQVLSGKKQVIDQFTDLNQELAKQKTAIEQIHTQFCSADMNEAQVVGMYKVPESASSDVVKRYADELRRFEGRVQDATRQTYNKSAQHANDDFEVVQRQAQQSVDSVQKEWEAQKPTKRGMFGWNGIPIFAGASAFCFGLWTKQDKQKKSSLDDAAMIGGGVFAGWNIFRIWQKYNKRRVCDEGIQHCKTEKEQIAHQRVTLQDYTKEVNEKIGGLAGEFTERREAMVQAAKDREKVKQEKKSQLQALPATVAQEVPAQTDTTSGGKKNSLIISFLKGIVGIDNNDPTLNNDDDDF